MTVAFYREGQTVGRAGQKQEKSRTDRTNAEQTGQTEWQDTPGTFRIYIHFNSKHRTRGTLLQS